MLISHSSQNCFFENLYIRKCLGCINTDKGLRYPASPTQVKATKKVSEHYSYEGRSAFLELMVATFAHLLGNDITKLAETGTKNANISLWLNFRNGDHKS